MQDSVVNGAHKKFLKIIILFSFKLNDYFELLIVYYVLFPFMLQKRKKNKDHIPRVEIWLEGHKRKDGKPINEAVKEKMVFYFVKKM